MNVSTFNTSTIQQLNNSRIWHFNNLTIQPFNKSTIQQFNSTIHQFNNSTIQQFNHQQFKQKNSSIGPKILMLCWLSLAQLSPLLFCFLLCYVVFFSETWYIVGKRFLTNSAQTPVQTQLKGWVVINLNFSSSRPTGIVL